MTIRLSRLVLAAALFGGIGTASALAQPGGSLIEVAIDHARVLQIDRSAGTVIVGNPSIVDIEVLSAESPTALRISSFSIGRARF